MSVAERRRSERRLAVTVVALFLLLGVAWVLLTDIVLYALVHNEDLITRIETAKGWIFVGLAALVLYAVAVRGASRLTRAHAATAAILDSIGDGVLILGPERTIVHANPAAVQMLGCEEEGDLVGMGPVEFSRRFRVSYPGGALVAPEDFVSQRVFDEGGPLKYRAVLYTTGDRPIFMSVTAAAVRLEVGAPADWVVSVMHDTTTSEELDRLRDQFFAASAHALKTPVAIIKGNAQVLALGLTGRLHTSTSAIVRQCGRIDRLVQNLCVLARARTRSLHLHPTEVDIGSLVERVAREMANGSPRHEIRAEVVASTTTWADPERLAMAVRNLIDRALRESVAGAEVTVLSTHSGADADIGVRHHPLPPEDRIPSQHEDYDDLSIGRQVTSTIVEAHGGSLHEETTPQGTTVWLRLQASEGRNASG